jgi:hypothetical protein
MGMAKSTALHLARSRVEQERYSHTVFEGGLSTRYAKDGRVMCQIGPDVINPLPGKGRTQDAMRRQRQRVMHLPLVAEDSNAIGDKYTRCNWGMCDESADLWPDPDDHIWPDMFENNGRVAPRGHGPCPMDVRTDATMDSGEMLGDSSGCFYSCRIFQRKHMTPSRDEAVALYDRMIAYRERTEGRLTKGDDPGEGEWDRDYGAVRRITNELLEKMGEKVML